jgi:hypothetical protein
MRQDEKAMMGSVEKGIWLKVERAGLAQDCSFDSGEGTKHEVWFIS